MFLMKVDAEPFSHDGHNPIRLRGVLKELAVVGAVSCALGVVDCFRLATEDGG